MRINKTVSDMVRILAHVHACGRNSMTISGIAEGLRLPQPSARKLVHCLVRSGLLVSSRGRKGGVRLARTAPDMPLGQLVLKLDSVTLGEKRARDRHHLVSDRDAGDLLDAAFSAFFKTLDTHVLADLLARPAPGNRHGRPELRRSSHKGRRASRQHSLTNSHIR